MSKAIKLHEFKFFSNHVFLTSFYNLEGDFRSPNEIEADIYVRSDLLACLRMLIKILKLPWTTIETFPDSWLVYSSDSYLAPLYLLIMDTMHASFIPLA